MSKIFKNFSILTISNLLQQTINFLCLAKIARILKVDDFGFYLLILTIVNIFQVISSLGLRQILIREIAVNLDAISHISRLALKILSIFLIFTSIALILYLNQFENIDSYKLILISTLLLISLTFWNVFEAVFFGKQLMHYSAIIGIIFSVFWFAIVFLFPQQLLVSVELILLIWVSVNICKTIVLFLLGLKKDYFKKIADKSISNISPLILLKYSMPIYGAAILALPINQFSILFLNINSDIKEVAYFGVGNKLLIPLSMISANLFNALFPNFSNYYSNDKIKYFEQTIFTFKSLIILNLFFSILLCSFVPELISFLFGEKYVLANSSFSLQIFVGINLIFHSFFGMLLITSKNEKSLFYLSFFNAISFVILNYLGSFYGAKGLAMFMLFGIIFSFAVHCFYINNIIRLNILISNQKNIIYYLILSFSSYYIINFSTISRTLFCFLALIVLITLNYSFLYKLKIKISTK